MANEIVLIVIACILSAILVYIVFITIGNENPEILYFFVYLKVVYLPSLLIILPFLVIGQFLLPKSNTAEGMTKYMITIEGSNSGEELELHWHELFYLSASGIYVEVFYISESVLEKKIFRAKLLDIETQVPRLFRTHRSYLINPLLLGGLSRKKTTYSLI